MTIPETTPDVDGQVVVDEDSPKKEVKDLLSEEAYKGAQTLRKSDFKRHVHWISVKLLYIITVCYLITRGIWLWHLITPESWHYMQAENYNKLQNLLFGTILGGFASQFARKIFSD